MPATVSKHIGLIVATRIQRRADVIAQHGNGMQVLEPTSQIHVGGMNVPCMMHSRNVDKPTRKLK